ncbi:hypothetical protein [Halomonas marinisediminis]|uniref:Uncharacterized protein n=1 Tax=Halomonas marinisediminis TaxID=2546095 RepID=A0ABY2DAC3_9GAMM|nr:hypothetical protein [Halomonas marinisediminis]TDB04993.1 hypothetical protein E0702_01935 [Halomonas marinisediminis]
MLHPNQFQVNEAWIAFRLNDRPLHTEEDGDFDIFAFMDAASCFLLSSKPISATADGPSKLESRRLLKQARAHKKRWPKTLFVPKEQTVSFIVAEAKRQGITVAHVTEDQLLPFIGEVREGFKESFIGSQTRLYD